MRLPLTDCPSKGCVGQDLNLRTPTGQDPEPCAFDQAWQPTHVAASKRFPRFVIIFRSWEPVGRSRTDSFGLRRSTRREVTRDPSATFLHDLHEAAGVVHFQLPVRERRAKLVPSDDFDAV